MEKTAMIFAAGLGTRLRPLTDDMPKALVEVSGRPLLWHTLRKLQGSGFRHVVVNTHHFADMVEDYLRRTAFPGMKIDISREEELLDTGGGVLHAERYLNGCGKFLVHNVDILSNAKLEEIEAASGDSLATLVVSDRRSNRHLLFDKDMRLSGWTDVTTGETRSPHGDVLSRVRSSLAFSGIHVISDRIFDAFRTEGLEGRFPIMDFYVGRCDKYDIRGLYVEGLRLLDVGKPEALAEAEGFLGSLARQ